MATFRIPMFGPGLRLNDVGNVRFETMQSTVFNGGTNDEFVAVFPDSDADDKLFGSFKIPENFVGSPNLIVPWTANTTSNNVVIRHVVYAIADGEDIDPVSATGSGSNTNAAPAVAGQLQSSVRALSGSYAANDIVRVEIGRNSGNAADTMEGIDVFMFYASIMFRYADV